MPIHPFTSTQAEFDTRYHELKLSFKFYQNQPDFPRNAHIEHKDYPVFNATIKELQYLFTLVTNHRFQLPSTQ